MSAARDPLSRHVRPRLTEERVTKQYAAIASRLPSRAGRRVWAPIGFALAGAVAALVIVFALRRGAPATTLADGTWLESAPSGAPPAVTLADGSRVALGAKSRVRLTSTRADAIRIDLERGRVDVQATHVEGRTFVAANEEWVEDEASDAAPATAPPATTNDDEESADDAGASLGPAAPRPRAAPSARDLLDDAQRALAQGRSQDAARLFDAIRREHRRDARAGLAAFELGRLRLDALGDPAGAEEAFRDAIKLARDGALRDDAEAARVEALDRLGSRDACARARDAYLQHRPRGVHRADVASRCGGT